MKSKYYNEGSLALYNHRPEDSCPYPPSSGGNKKRIQWYNGYLDARSWKTLGHIFKKHGITWP